MEPKNKGSIGIMTFHWAPNYGAVLQAWALQQFFIQHHYHAELIDYVPKSHRISFLRCFMTKHLYKMSSRLTEYRREQKIQAFRRKYMLVSKAKYGHQKELAENPPEYDYYVSGSDQIWNPSFTMDGRDGVNLSYFLRFVPKGKKKVAIASSFGAKILPEKMATYVKDELNEFDAVGVREEEAKELLEKLGIKAECILDPTLLFKADAYYALLPEREEKEKSIFQYMLHKQEQIGDQVSDKISAEYGQSVDKSKYLSIEDWLFKIRNASLVITNSFHCVVFSLLFHTPFIAIDVQGTEMSSRITTLLSKVGLEERFLKLPLAEEQYSNLRDIDWNNVDIALQKHRDHSQAFILRALERIEHVGQVPKADCTGCSLCVHVCPHKSITMVEDQRGFLYPRIDETTCIKCGLCAKKCIVNQSKPLDTENYSPKGTYACWHTDPQIRLTSSSGGAFSALAETVFHQSGTVCGAAFVAPMKLAHVIARKADELAALRGSKYMPSGLSASFEAVRSLLDCGKKVLFSGTPCQVAAMKQYTGNHERLICIDLACHGVPSPKVLEANCSAISKKTSKTVDHIHFRNKKHGWANYSYTYFDYVNHEIASECVNNSNFISGYIDNLFLRPSCEGCSFASVPRVGDLTLADCWYKVHRGLDQDDKGITALLVNTDKGKALFDAARDRMHVEDVLFSDVISGTPMLVRPSGSNQKKTLFWDTFEKHGLSAAFHKVYFTKNIQSVVKRLVRGLKS